MTVLVPRSGEVSCGVRTVGYSNEPVTLNQTNFHLFQSILLQQVCSYPSSTLLDQFKRDVPSADRKSILALKNKAPVWNEG